MKFTTNYTFTAHNRETWLNSMLANHITNHFKQSGYDVPQNIRLSCSLTNKRKAIGVCYDPTMSLDGVSEIFISPSLDDSVRVVDVLIHEVCHAVVGNKNGHNTIFGKCARSVGLEGKLTATIASAELKEKILKWVEIEGEYPHAYLDTSKVKKQSTRLLKCVCGECGYTVRLAKKWLDVATPECPNRDCDNYNFQCRPQKQPKNDTKRGFAPASFKHYER